MLLPRRCGDGGPVREPAVQHRLERCRRHWARQPQYLCAVPIPLAAISAFALGVVIVAGIIARRAAR